MPYCPNCSAALHDGAQTCSKCSADFSARSGWRPTTYPRPRPLPSLVSEHRRPALGNAVQSAIVFPLLGPPIGALLFVLTVGDDRGTLAGTLLFAVIWSWSLALIPAGVAGLMYGIAGAMLVRVFRISRLSAPVAIALGGAAGTFGYLLANPARRFGVAKALSESPTFELTIVSCAAGALVALLAAWLFPIGTQGRSLVGEA